MSPVKDHNCHILISSNLNLTPDPLSPFPILTPSHFTLTAPNSPPQVRHYCATVVNSTEEADDPTDSDTGEVLSFENLVFNLFDFLTR